MKSAFKTLSTLALAFAATSAFAANLTWDPTQVPGTPAGGNGAWDTTSAFWSNLTTDAAWANANNDTAVFGGTSGTVNLGTTITAGGLTFGSTGYTIGNGGTAGNTLTLAGTTPTITVTNSSDTATISAVIAGSAGLTKSGAGTLVITSGTTYTGATTIAGGTIVFSGDTAANGTRLAGVLAGSSGTISFLGANTGATSGSVSSYSLTGTNTLTSGATLVANNSRLSLATQANAGAATLSNLGNGQFYLTGAITYTNNFIIQGIGWGEDAGNLGALRMQGATLSGTVTLAGNTRITAYGSTGTISGVIGQTGGARSLEIGTATGGGTVTLSGLNTYTGGTIVTGGTLAANATNSSNGTIGGGNVTVNSGGTITIQNDNGLTGYSSSSAKTTTINAGGTITTTTGASNHMNALVLNGGTLSSTAVNASYGNWNFDWGVSTGGLGTTSYISGGNAGLTQAGGTIFNIQGSDTLNVSTVLGTFGGAIGLIKNGTGKMVLSATNTYAGATTINAGTLALNATGALTGSAVTVNTGGTFRIDTTGKTLAALTLNDGAKFYAGIAAGQTTTVTGALTFGASANVTVGPVVTGLLTTGSTFDLITANSITGTPASLTADFNANGASRVTGTAAVVGNKVQVTVTSGAASLVWAAAAGTGTWDLNTTSNFTNGGSADKFFAYDAVTFDDTVTGATRTVTLAGSLAPSSITVNNSTGDYVFAGSGTLTGGGSLTKNGTGSLTLTSGYGVSGAINLNAGTLNLGGATIGSSGLVMTGGTLSNGTLNASSYDARSGIISAILAGPGALTKTTSGTLTLSGANTYSGGTTVSAGTLVVNSASGLGTGALTVNAGAQATFGVTNVGNRIVNLAGGTLAIGRTLNYTADSQPINFTANNALVTTTGSGANATITDFDVNSVALNVSAGVTGGVVDSTVNLATNSYGFRIDVATGGDLTVGGVIAGAGAANIASAGPIGAGDTVAFYKRGAGNVILTGASTYTAGSSTAAASIEGRVTLSGGDNRLPAASAVYLGSTANVAGELALNGISQTLTGLATIGTSTASKVVGGSATLATLTLNNTAVYTFAGTLGGTGTNENNLAFIKTGAGAFTLSGINTYTGNTTISQGSVTLTSTGAFLMKISNGGVSNSISVASGATLGFSGALNLDLTGLTNTAGTWNLITGAGTKTYDPATFVVKINGGASFTKNANLWTNGNFTFDTNTGVLTAVPEPSTYGLLGAGALAAVAFVRRRRKTI